MVVYIQACVPKRLWWFTTLEVLFNQHDSVHPFKVPNKCIYIYTMSSYTNSRPHPFDTCVIDAQKTTPFNGIN